MRIESTGRGALETLGVLAAFVAFGLGWAEVVARAPADRPPYPARMVDDFEAFVSLAPDAPEAASVKRLLATFQ